MCATEKGGTGPNGRWVRRRDWPSLAKVFSKEDCAAEAGQVKYVAWVAPPFTEEAGNNAERVCVCVCVWYEEQNGTNAVELFLGDFIPVSKSADERRNESG